MTIEQPGSEGQVPPQPTRPLEPHRGTLILVLGILSLVGCTFFAGIPAWILGNADLNKMKQGLMDRAGEGNTSAGRIMGIISVILGIIGVIFTILWFVVIAAAIAGGAASGQFSP